MSAGGNIGIICNDAARYSLFNVCLSNLKRAPGAALDWAMGTDMVQGRNALVRRALEADVDWLLFLDDDHVFQSDLLLRLLSHEEDIVGSLYLRRNIPFSPVAFASREEDGTYTSIDLTTLPREGLLKVQAVGTSGMLIRTDVFRSLEDPWFEYGMTGKYNASEDIIFCEKAQEMGYDVYLDLGAHLGHLTPSAIWPSWVDQEWAVGFSVADGLRLFCPIEKAVEAADAVRR